MKFSLATLFAVLVASAAAQDAFFFEADNESCTVADDGEVECTPGEASGAQRVARSRFEARAPNAEAEAEASNLERRWPTCWGSGGAARCQAKCRGMGKRCGSCLGFAPTCYCNLAC